MRTNKVEITKNKKWTYCFLSNLISGKEVPNIWTNLTSTSAIGCSLREKEGKMWSNFPWPFWELFLCGRTTTESICCPYCSCRIATSATKPYPYASNAVSWNYQCIATFTYSLQTFSFVTDYRWVFQYMGCDLRRDWADDLCCNHALSFLSRSSAGIHCSVSSSQLQQIIPSHCRNSYQVAASENGSHLHKKFKSMLIS